VLSQTVDAASHFVFFADRHELKRVYIQLETKAVMGAVDRMERMESVVDLDQLVKVFYEVVRLVAAGCVVWYASGCTK
jgi:hypothetical protein